MNNVKRLAAIIVVSALVVTPVFAVEGGNSKKGKYLYKKGCKSCHAEDSEGGELTPMSKTMAQWDRFIKKSGAKCAEKVEGLNEKDILDINQFLFDHAADSDQPQTCG